METHTPHEHTQKKDFWDLHTVNICIATILGIVVLVNLFLAGSIQKTQPAVPGKQPLPKIELTSITTDCKECQNLDQAVASLKQKYNVTKETTLAGKEAESLVEKYKIARLPSIVMTGELDKVSEEGFDKADDALVYTAVKAPYVDPKTNEVMGKLDITYLLANACEACANITGISDQLKSSGVAIGNVKKFDISEDAGKGFAEKYNISRVPTVIFSSSAKEYDAISQPWPQVGTIEKDGSYVLRAINAPYYDVAQSKVRGIVTLTLVNDTECKECYDVQLHRNILGLNFGIKAEKEIIVDADSSEGKKLVDKYKLQAVPTFIISGDVEAYEALVKVWPTVGTVEDGAYVFRDLSVLKMTYLNLSTGKVQAVNASEAQ